MIELRYRIAEGIVPKVQDRWGAFKNGKESHSHPVLANERLLVRDEVIRLAGELSGTTDIIDDYRLSKIGPWLRLAVMSDRNAVLNKCYVNVGGRPFLNGSALVRACAPLVSPSDFARRANYKQDAQKKLSILATQTIGERGTAQQWERFCEFSDGLLVDVDRWVCTHKFEECECYPGVKAFISIHSIYYIAPEDLFAVLRKFPGVPFIAAFHRFPDPNGLLGCGEAKYSWNPQEKSITMTVSGNLESYVHSDMHWVWGGGLAMGMAGTLCWSQISQIGETSIVQFHATEIRLPVGIRDVPDLLTGLRNREYVGQLSFSTIKDDPIRMPDEGYFQVQTAVSGSGLFSYLNWIVIGSDDAVLLPKSMIWDLAQRCVGKKRDSELLKTLTLHARAGAKKLALTEKQRFETVVYGSYIAMHIGAQLELNAIATHEHHASLWRPLNSYYDGTAWVLGRGAAMLGLAVLGAITVFAPMSAKSKILGLSVVTGASYLLTKKPPSPGAAGGRKVTNVCSHGIKLEPQQIGSKIKVTEDVECKAGFGAKLLGFGLPGVLPTVARSCVHNDYLAIRNRMAIENRVVLYKPDGTVETEDRDWRHIHRMMSDLPKMSLRSKIDLPIRAYPFEGWIGTLNVSGSRKDMLRRMYTTMKHKNFKSVFATLRDSARASFVKIEKAVGNPEACPRLIQGASPEFQVATGPITKALSVRMKDTYTINHYCFYTSGAKPSDIGRFVDQIHEMPPIEGGYVFGENDCGRYDATQSRGSLETEMLVYKTANLSEKHQKTIELEWKSHGQTSNQVRYVCYYKRNSGDGNTSSGNSITNFAACCGSIFLTPEARVVLQGMGVEFVEEFIPGDEDSGLPPTTYWRADLEPVIKKYSRFMVLGDDNLMIVPAVLAQVEPATKFLLDLGLRPELKFSKDVMDVEFCSGRFYPSSRGTIWGPKIGRVLAKTGWALKPYGRRRTQQWLKGVALGMMNDVAHIPVLRVVTATMARVAGNAKPMDDIEMKKYRWYEHEHEPAEATDDTILFVCAVYDCTPGELRALEDEIVGVKSLPHVIKNPLAMRMMSRDIKIKMEENAVIESTGPKLVTGSIFGEWLFGRMEKAAHMLYPYVESMRGWLASQIDLYKDQVLYAFRAAWSKLGKFQMDASDAVLDFVGFKQNLREVLENDLSKPQECREPGLAAVHALDDPYNQVVNLFAVVVWAPLTEEFLKKVTMTRFGMSIACGTIISIEWVNTLINSGHTYWPTALMHILCDRLPYGKAVLVHACWNFLATWINAAVEQDRLNKLSSGSIIAAPSFGAFDVKETLKANFHFSHICLLFTPLLVRTATAIVKMVKVKGQKKKVNNQPQPQRQNGKRKSRAPREGTTAYGPSYPSLPKGLLEHPYALARLNPFDSRAEGAKVPDFDNNFSATITGHMEFSLTSTSAGNLTALFPLIPAHMWSMGGLTNGNVKFDGVPNGLPEHATNFSGWDECSGLRVVGVGAKIDTTLNANNAQGRIYLIPMSSLEMRGYRIDPVNNIVPNSTLTRKHGVARRAVADLAAEGGMAFVGSILDPTALTYIDPAWDQFVAAYNGPVANQMGFAILAEGLPASSTCIEVSIVIHLEFLPGNKFQYMSTRAEPSNIRLLEQINNVAEQAPRAIERVGDIGAKLITAFKTGVKVVGALGLL